MNSFETMYDEEMLSEAGAFKNFVLSAALGASPLLGTAAYQHHQNHQNPDSSTQTSISQPAQVATQDEATVKLKNVIARTLWAEARVDGNTGMRAVASVIYNRAGGNTNNMIPVIKKRKQFSCWNGMTDKDWSDFKLKDKSGAQWRTANAIANEMVDGSFITVTGANHYYNPDKCDPSWSRSKAGKTHPFKVIGHHRFMTL